MTSDSKINYEELNVFLFNRLRDKHSQPLIKVIENTDGRLIAVNTYKRELAPMPDMRGYVFEDILPAFHRMCEGLKCNNALTAMETISYSLEKPSIYGLAGDNDLPPHNYLAEFVPIAVEQGGFKDVLYLFKRDMNHRMFHTSVLSVNLSDFLNNFAKETIKLSSLIDFYKGHEFGESDKPTSTDIIVGSW